MIRVLIVEDDYRIAELHREYTQRVPGFSVVGQASTGAEGIRLAGRTRPDLVLLDVYLPDMTGLEVLSALRGAGQPEIDVIAITAARDVETLRSAMQSGVVHYLIKPFRFAAFEEKLKSYAALRDRMGRITEADQHDVDRLYGLLRPTPTAQDLPKGLSMPTLALVEGAMSQGSSGLSAEEVAQKAGISRVTARRYLDHLAQVGRVEVRMRYGSRGRPEHRYRLSAAPLSS
jgi:response regulator of citrate/malate metabolism